MRLACHPSCESSRAETWQAIIRMRPEMKTTKVFTTAALGCFCERVSMKNN
jgi:hypothetical protein